jgi:hypothetical protein
MEVGKRGENALVKARKALKVKSREALWRTAAAPSPNAAAAQVLRSVYDLMLPDATVGSKRPPSYWLDHKAAAATAKDAKAALERAEAAFGAAMSAGARHKQAIDAFHEAMLNHPSIMLVREVDRLARPSL